jgi:hypothetical protein
VLASSARAVTFTSNTLIDTGNSAYEGQDLVVSNCTLTVNGPHGFNSLRVTGSGVVTHSAATTIQAYALDLTIAGSLVIDATARIDVSGRGYLAGRTAGNSTDGGATGTAGGSYGGLGFSYNGSANAVYGADYRDPSQPGSGSGPGGGAPSAGGGLVRITAGSAQIDGAILANGATGTVCSSGGGSGGGLLLNVGTLSGSGQLAANGGSGADSWCGSAGSGGGGRVAVTYTTVTGFDLTSLVTAHGGGGGPRYYLTATGDLGTVYYKQNGGPGTLLLANHGQKVSPWTYIGLPSDTIFAVDSLVVSGAGVVAATAGGAPIQANAVALLNGAVLTHLAATTDRVYELEMTVAGSLTIDASSRLDVSGRGYLGGRTVGNTTVGAATGHAGGAYGGLGAAGANWWGRDGQCNPAYGDYLDPNDLGSGGSPGGSTGAGGGLVRISAGSAQIDGAILANGGAASSGMGGASGGSIRLDVGTLSGSGQIAANGANGHYVENANLGGGGGGGRVAVYYANADGFDLTNRVLAHGGAGTGAALGSVGTVFLQPNGGAGQLLITSHATAAGLWTPLGSPTDAVFQADNLVVSGTGVMAATAGGAPIQANAVAVVNGAVLTHQPATADHVYALAMAITGSLTIDASSRLDVTGRGYLAGRTVGNTTAGAATGHAGGAYGGLGAAGGNWWGRDGQCNSAYGDYLNPNDLGSGGSPGGSTGAGGGLVRISAGSAQIDGAILANGGAASSGMGGASGGGIRLDVGTLSGSGQIAANGANGHYVENANWGGSGGGGRVAVYYANADGFDLTNRVMAHGGTGTGSAVGSVGTVYLQPSGGTGQLLVTSHGTAVGLWTPLGRATDAVLQAGTLVVSGAGVVAVATDGLPIEAVSVTLRDGAVLSHLPATSQREYSLRLTVTGSLLVDATAKIDVTGRGYLAGTTVGNTTVGAATGSGGGSYGGLGGHGGCAWTLGSLYGDEHDPFELGSGGSGAAGGGLVRITAGSAQIEGAILANGANSGSADTGGGSGGGVLLNVGTLSGSGQVAANGGSRGWSQYCGGGNGGGGRVAIYTWNAMTLPVANVTANATGGNGAAQPGSVYVTTSTFFAWENPAPFAHGTAAIAWHGLGVGPGAAFVDILALGAGDSYPVTAGAAAIGSYGWDTTAVPDGIYELQAVLRDTAAHVLHEISRTVLVNNAVTWHAGVLAASETWGAGTVHVVERNVVIPSGVTLTIQPGAIIKFATGVGITVQAGGVLDASGAEADSPILFTALTDDAAGGDSNCDGDNTRPQAGEWPGLAVFSGQFISNAFVEIRYPLTTHSGTLALSAAWMGNTLHLVTGTITIPSGIALTINPGAVVKFAAGTGLTVSAGGTLTAQGTVAQPIIFTSIKDDTIAGDSNGDGTASAPGAGDWRSLRFEGSATASLRQVDVRYGGNSVVNVFGAGGMIEATGGSLLVDACRISESAKDGIVSSGATTISNTVVTACDRGVVAWSDMELTNCTLDDNRQGAVEHAGTLTLRNCIVVHSLQFGVLHDYGTERVTVTNSDVWNPGAVNYSGTADKTGQNGNLSVDPQLKNAAAGDYRLDYRSPCIDAADGAAAPAADFMGAPRYDDPRTANTGTPTGGGAYADLGAFEFVETAASGVDLIGTAVSGPATVVAGDSVTVSWMVVNTGSGRATGPWHDAITLALVSGAGEPIWAGEALIGQGVVLGPGQSYRAAATVRVPGAVEGDYRWQVQVNSRGEIFEVVNWTNNVAVAGAPTRLTVPALAIGGLAFTSTFAAAGQAHWFRVDSLADADVVVSLDLAGNGGVTELYVGRGYLPTLQQFDARQMQWHDADVSVVLPATSTPSYYVMAYCRRLPTGSTEFTVSAQIPDFGVQSVTPGTVGNTGYVTFAVRGYQFAAETVFEAVSPAGSPRQAVADERVSSALAYVTFDLTGAQAGGWTVQARQAGATAGPSAAFAVTQGGGPSIVVDVLGREEVREGRTYAYTIAYSNVGNVDAYYAMIVLYGLPNDASVVLGPEFVAPPVPDGLAGSNPLSMPTADGLRFTPLILSRLRPGEAGAASFRVTVPIGATGFSISPVVFEPAHRFVSSSDATGGRAMQQALTAADSGADSAAKYTWGCGPDPLDQAGLDCLYQIAKQKEAAGNFTQWASGGACMGEATWMQGFYSAAASDPSSPAYGWKFSRVNKETVSVSDVGFGHVTVLAKSPTTGKYYIIDNYVAATALPVKPVGAGEWYISELCVVFGQLDPFVQLDHVLTVGGGFTWVGSEPSKDSRDSEDTGDGTGDGGTGGGGFGSSSGMSCSRPKPQPPKPVEVKGSVDPNVKIGPIGYGVGHFLDGRQPLGYRIDFENQPTASAAAQEVRVTDTLSSQFDWSTFELLEIGFNGVRIAIPSGRQSFTTTVVVSTDPNPVRVTAGLDPTTGVVSWVMQSIDPVTGQLVEDPQAGFLPPNDATQAGEGYVSFTVELRPGLPTGTQITNQASIVFDVNAPIETNVALNTLDAEAPASAAVAVRRAGAGNDLWLSFSGADGAGSGIGAFDVWVGIGAAPATFWGAVADPFAALFEGAWETTYHIYLRARDNVGHTSAMPSVANASLRTPQWALRVDVAQADLAVLYLGADALATTGFDSEFDEDAPPVGRPAGTVALVGTDAGHERLSYDCQPQAATVSWLLEVTPGTDPVRLSWEPERAPAGRWLWLVRVDAEGSPQGATFADMLSVDSLEIAAPGNWLVTLSDAPPEHALTYLAGPHGAIVGPTPQTVAHGSAGTAVTAEPAPGYHFIRWSDGSLANPRTDTNVEAELTVTAEFADITAPTVSGLVDDDTPTQSKTWTWGSTKEIVTYRHLIDRTPGGVPTGPYGTVTTATQPAGDGLYYLHVQATDDAGNESSVVTVYAILDNTAPALAFLAPLSGQHVNAATTITFTDSERTAPQVSLDNHTWTPAASGTTTLGSIPAFAAVRPGVFTLYLRDADTAGNPGTASQAGIVNDPPGVPPHGEFAAEVSAAEVLAGRGWWDLSGTYVTAAAGNPLVLNVIHDPTGKVSGMATCTIAKATVVTMPIKGSVKGSRGSTVMKCTLKGADLTRTVNVALTLNLMVDTANRHLTGWMAGSITSNGATTPVDEDLSLAIPAGMDGSWTLRFNLGHVGRTVTGTAILTLANGVDYTCVARGRAGAHNATLLSLVGDPADPASKAIRIRTTITPLEGGWARLQSFSGKGYGQAVGWGQ